MKPMLTFISLLFLTFSSYAQTKVIDSLMKAVSYHSGDTLEVHTLDNLANEFMRTDVSKAKYFAHQELRLSNAIGFDNGISNAYATLVTMHQRSGNMDSAQYYLSQYELLYKKNPAYERVAINYYNTAGLFYKSQGRYKESLPYLLETLKLIGPHGKKVSQAGQMLNIGNTYHGLGNFTNAVKYHLNSLTLFEEIKNQRGQSFVLQSLGNDFLLLKQYQVAEKYFLRSEKIKQEAGDNRGLLSSWTSLGEVYRHQGDPVHAMAYITKALTRAQELNLNTEQKDLLFSKGLILKSQNKNNEARETFLDAIAIARNSGDSLYISKLKSELIMLNQSSQQAKEKEHTLTENVNISTDKGDLINAADGHNKLAEWYAAHNQFDKAFENLKRAHQLDDSLRGNEIIVQLKQLEEEYQSEKKEKEIALLRKDQELQALTLREQKAFTTSVVIAFLGVLIIGLLLINRYSAVNRVKRQVEIERIRNGIARDLHDDIGSTLSSINILSQVALVEKNGNVDNYLQRINDQSTRMMEDIGDIVWSINPRNDSMIQVITRMREFSGEVFDSKNVFLSFTDNISKELRLNAGQRKNIFLIFKETINNSAKYSSAHKVDISIFQEDDTLVMQVSDNGKGFDEHTIKAGNGLRNIRERAKEIQGIIKLTSAPGKGTAIEFRLPLA
jgi:signal transduction histidine kinase